MVATTDRYATEVGVNVLEAGGSVVDAAVAVSFALAVVNPEAGNLGGGGFLLLRNADGSIEALDYRSCAPASATRDMFLEPDGRPGERSVLGHEAVAVPGSVRGLWDAHQRHGALAWRDLVQPAVTLARGFTVRDRFVESFPPHIIEGLSRFPASARVFLPGGAPPAVGTTLDQPDLAETLGRIRDLGADGFYVGETADLIVAEMERGGGHITHEDLSEYRAVWREAVRAPYRGHTIVSMPPSSSGGATLAMTAGLLSAFEVGALDWHSSEHIHLLVEAWKRAFADRNRFLADPAFVQAPSELFDSAVYGAGRGGEISMARATPSGEVGPGVAGYSGSGNTTHFSIVDADGCAASVTTTLNTWYGSKVLVEGAGVLLNNEMDDFTGKPGAPNFFGLVQGEANAIEPGKRPLSAMTPTIVLDPGGDLLLVVGSPGGATIITTVFQTISNIVDHGMDVDSAVCAPRVHHQHLPDGIRFEPGGLTAGVVGELESLGHDVVVHDEMKGDVQAIVRLPDGTLRGRADPRRGGTAAGI